MGKDAKNITRIAIKSMPIPDTSGDSKNPIPQMQIQSYDAVKNCGKLGHYGFYGNAPTGSLVMVIQANGQEEFLLGAEDDVNNRPRDLKEGEVMIYNTLTKSHIFLNEDGEIFIYNDKTESSTLYDKEGNINIYAKKDIKLDVDENANITIKGNATINVTGDTTLTSPNTTINGKVFINGDTSIVGNTTMTGNLTVTGTAFGAILQAGNGVDLDSSHTVTTRKGIAINS